MVLNDHCIKNSAKIPKKKMSKITRRPYYPKKV